MHRVFECTTVFTAVSTAGVRLADGRGARGQDHQQQHANCKADYSCVFCCNQIAGVRLADGRVFKGKTVISNATRWDTFEGMVGESKMPESEKLFRWALMLYFGWCVTVHVAQQQGFQL
jgi:hypothetical protein